jgi:hypothetical protein
MSLIERKVKFNIKKLSLNNGYITDIVEGVVKEKYLYKSNDYYMIQTEDKLYHILCNNVIDIIDDESKYINGVKFDDSIVNAANKPNTEKNGIVQQITNNNFNLSEDIEVKE